ncbi:hypothetical protein [Serratia fonticola]|uniref:hypothetical protein n=1 Tax=Serratia fonticola TaxID=47917 RepID=UPI0021780CC4|nr:hypothetical protein [Serratia fonticola]CAI1985402.1 Uncharacterised protein [Serratia fonticola]
MSIHISCYTTYNLAELQGKLNAFAEKYPCVFPAQYYLSNGIIPHPIQREVASDFGLVPCSYFVISVNNKSLKISTDEMAEMIRKELGSDNVIVLLNGEDLI